MRSLYKNMGLGLSTETNGDSYCVQYLAFRTAVLSIISQARIT